MFYFNGPLAQAVLVIMWNNTDTPIAYLITFRAYGTWLHGDERGSVDRFHNVYGKPMLPLSRQRQKYERSLLSHAPVKLSAAQRGAVEKGCEMLVLIVGGCCGPS